MEGTSCAPHMLGGPPSDQGGVADFQPVPAVVYPEPEATHEDVVADRALFMRLLQHLHSQLAGVQQPSKLRVASKFRVPVVCGKELDLHTLYVRVTGHGGLESVISNRKWTDVCEPFNFPSSFTSKSFTVRKIYSQFLHHFEQTYFHRRAGQPLAEAPTPPPQQAAATATAKAATAAAASAVAAAVQQLQQLAAAEHEQRPVDQVVDAVAPPQLDQTRAETPAAKRQRREAPFAAAAPAVASFDLAAVPMLPTVVGGTVAATAATAAAAASGEELDACMAGVLAGGAGCCGGEGGGGDDGGAADGGLGGFDVDADAANALQMLMAEGCKAAAAAAVGSVGPSAQLPPLPPGTSAAPFAATNADLPASAFLDPGPLLPVTPGLPQLSLPAAGAPGAAAGHAAAAASAAAGGALAAAAPGAQPLVPPERPPELVAYAAHPLSQHGARDLTGAVVEGTVDGRFDVGYFVSLTVRGSHFKGILYCPMGPLAPHAAPHTAPHAAPGTASPTGHCSGGSVPIARAGSGGGMGGRGRLGSGADLFGQHLPPAARQSSGGGQKRGKGQPHDKPKASKTAFNFFAAAHWQQAKDQVGPGASSQDVSRLVGEWWARTAGAAREPFVAQAAADKRRFQAEKRRFERRLAGMESSSEEEREELERRVQAEENEEAAETPPAAEAAHASGGAAAAIAVAAARGRRGGGASASASADEESAGVEVSVGGQEVSMGGEEPWQQRQRRHTEEEQQQPLALQQQPALPQLLVQQQPLAHQHHHLQLIPQHLLEEQRPQLLHPVQLGSVMAAIPGLPGLSGAAFGVPAAAAAGAPLPGYDLQPGHHTLLGAGAAAPPQDGGEAPQGHASFQAMVQMALQGLVEPCGGAAGGAPGLQGPQDPAGDQHQQQQQQQP